MALASVIPFDRSRPPEAFPAPAAVSATGRSAATIGRRAVDLLVASLALLLLSPALLGLAALVGATPGPLLVRRRCLGRGFSEFALLAFRTTAHDPAEPLRPRRGLRAVPRPRVTGLGRLLRRWRLDRLPALVNVLRGDLTLVGPAPLTAAELRALPRGEQRRRYAVQPGWVEPLAGATAPAEDHPGPAVGF